jgi:uncharacterized protein YcfJ
MTKIHDKVVGSTLGAVVAGLIAAEFVRAGVHLNPEELAAVTVLGTFVGGYLKRIGVGK